MGAGQGLGVTPLEAVESSFVVLADTEFRAHAPAVPRQRLRREIVVHKLHEPLTGLHPITLVLSDETVREIVDDRRVHYPGAVRFNVRQFPCPGRLIPRPALLAQMADGELFPERITDPSALAQPALLQRPIQPLRARTPRGQDPVPLGRRAPHAAQITAPPLQLSPATPHQPHLHGPY
ncbi:hypothetical protein [Amycolatopsis sp.]|uniref:hypothetical protein n=1 Tax=Amycolatopsis sp. TaxID=37632 RepID=UPI002E0A963F|nr:hypothetical protein [Amycolatopsis sp.]